MTTTFTIFVLVCVVLCVVLTASALRLLRRAERIADDIDRRDAANKLALDEMFYKVAQGGIVPTQGPAEGTAAVTCASCGQAVPTR
jgi:hypothetical protein